jgi:hypothetical protein
MGWDTPENLKMVSRMGKGGLSLLTATFTRAPSETVFQVDLEHLPM